MTAAGPGAEAGVELRWMPGLTPGCPGAVDVAMNGPLGRIERAVTLPEALTMSVMVDLLFPPSNMTETVAAIAAQAAHRREA